MNQRDLKRSLSDHYSAKTLPAHRTAQLHELAKQSPQRHRVKGARSELSQWFRWRISALSAAATLALTLAGVYVLELNGQPLVPNLQRLVGSQPADIRPAAFGSAEVVAVRLYADWCKPSHVMQPRCSELKRTFATEDVLFIDLDVTDQNTRKQGEYLMSALGLEDIWTEHGSISGEMLIVDPKRKVVLATLTQEHDVPSMTSALNEALYNPPKLFSQQGNPK